MSPIDQKIGCLAAADRLCSLSPSVNGEPSSSSAADPAPAGAAPGATEEAALPADCTGTAVQDPPAQESRPSSENSDCVASASAQPGTEARSVGDPDHPDAASSSAFDKSRQPEGCAESARQQSGNASAETLPSGYVKDVFAHLTCISVAALLMFNMYRKRFQC